MPSLIIDGAQQPALPADSSKFQKKSGLIVRSHRKKRTGDLEK
jgi:hypothetical protein